MFVTLVLITAIFFTQELFAQSSTNPRADTVFQAASFAHRQQRFGEAAILYQDHIVLAGETPRTLRAIAQCLWNGYPQNLDSLRKAQQFMQRYTAKGGKETSAQGIIRNIDAQIAAMIQDSIQRAQALIAQAERRRLDSLARLRQDSLDRYWAGQKERLEYLRLRKGSTVNLIAGGGIYLRREAINVFDPASYSGFTLFGELGADARYAHWFTDAQSGDMGLMVDYGVGIHQVNINPNETQNFDIRAMNSFWANARFVVGDIGIGTLQTFVAYRHEWGSYYKIAASSDDKNTQLIVNMLGAGVTIEPAIGRYGFLASLRYFPKPFSFGINTGVVSADAWNAVIGYQFPKFGFTMEGWLAKRTHTGLVPEFTHNTLRLRLFFEIYEIREYKWF